MTTEISKINRDALKYAVSVVILTGIGAVLLTCALFKQQPLKIENERESVKERIRILSDEERHMSGQIAMLEQQRDLVRKHMLYYYEIGMRMDEDQMKLKSPVTEER